MLRRGLRLEPLEHRRLLASAPQLLKDINPNGASLAQNPFVQVGGLAYFVADNGTAGPELWRTDGTSAGTVLVKDIRPGTSGSVPTKLTNVGGTLYFRADDGTGGAELWKSDGTSTGTTLVSDIRPGTNGSVPDQLTPVGGTLYFTANDGTSGIELWKSNGTSTGTIRVRDLLPGGNGSNPDQLTERNGALFFAANEGTSGIELWKSDGTSGGTVRVRDINPGVSGASVTSLTNVAGTLYFSADNGVNGQNLWKSDGTSGGTIRVHHVRPSFITAVGSAAYFSADDGTHGRELWKTNGTSSGTLLVHDIAPATSDAFPRWLTNAGGTLYFAADDGTVGTELWKTDGTSTGTVLVRDLYAGTAGPYPRFLTNAGGTLFFVSGQSTTGTELWRSNGTSSGTQLVADLMPGATGAYPTYLQAVNGRLFFAAMAGTTANEPWVMVFNEPPVLNPLPSRVLNEGALLNFQAVASDPDAGSTLTYSLAPGAPAGATMNPSTGQFQWTPADQVGSPFSVTVIVTDNFGFSDSETFAITVNNVPPTAAVGGPANGAAGQTLNFNLSATDPSSADTAAGMTYRIDWNSDGTFDQWKSGPAAGTAVSHVFSTPGTYVVAVQAQDKDLAYGPSVMRTVVISGPQPPVLNPIGNRSVNESSVLSFTATATDPNPGDTLTFSLGPDAPEGVSIHPTTGLFQGSPLDNVGSPFPMTIVVTDATGLVDSELILVTVNNVAPTTTISGPANGVVGQALNFNFTASDPSLVDLAAGMTYRIDWNNDGTFDQWRSGPAAGTVVSHTFTAPGTYVISVSARDKDFAYGPPVTRTVVIQGNLPPVLNAIGNRAVNEGSLLSFTATASDPNPGSTLTYSLAPGAPAGATINPTTGQFQWTPADNVGSPFPITVRVTDNTGLTDSELIQVTVSNVAPTAGIAGPSTGVAGQPITLVLVANDPSSVDRAAPIVYRFDWNNDGTYDQWVTGAATSTPVTHTFPTAGTYVVRVQARDKEQAYGTVTTKTVVISAPFAGPQAALDYAAAVDRLLAAHQDGDLWDPLPAAPRGRTAQRRAAGPH